MQSVYYLPPISWFSELLRSGEPLSLNYDERWQKQSLRNRCYIDSPNGRLMLSIPIDKSSLITPSPLGEGLGVRLRDVKLSRQLPWQHQHWQAFETSYYNSPFFEYLQDDFRPVYEKDWTYLVDLNETLINICLNLLDLNLPAEKTINSTSPLGEGVRGVRPYQVFENKHPFLEDLSIIDLLFNEGPESAIYL